MNPAVTLAGSGADGELLGVYFADAGQHLESQVFLFHQADHTKGRVEYRGALQGDGARTVWIGDVLIGPDATGTDSYEQNRNLVLTDGTRADSVPNLEIETGDIAGAGPRLRHRPLRRRAALLPAGPRHHRGGGAAARRPRLPRRRRAEDRRARARDAPARRDRGRARRTAPIGAGPMSAAIRVCGVDDLEVDTALRVDVGRHARRGRARTRAATIHAIGDTCTHGDISLAEGFVEDETLECWAHGSKFSLHERTPAHPAGLPAGARLPGRGRGRRRARRPHPDPRRGAARLTAARRNRRTIRMSTLSIADLHVSVETDQGTKQILRGVDLTIREGETHAVMGPNGSGKSTLAYTIAGHPKYHVESGSIHARRRGRARDDRRPARPRRPLPRDAVPGRDPRRHRLELPPHREDRDRRRGARHPRLGQGRPRVDERAPDGPGLRGAQRERGLLRRREEAQRDPPARAAEAAASRCSTRPTPASTSTR